MRLITRKVGFIVLIVLSCSCLWRYMSRAEEAGQEETFQYQLKLKGIVYTGNYAGQTKNGRPEGTGTFISDVESPQMFTYTGEFKNGTFDGDGEVDLLNGDCLKGKFKEGYIDGKATLLHENGNYDIIRYKWGVPYGSFVSWSIDDKIIAKDFFYDGIKISDWKQEAVEIPYRDLFNQGDSIYGQLLKLDCVVLNVYENASNCIFKLKDKDGNIYWGAYENGQQLTYSQSLMPTLKKGDELELYAFFRGVTRYSCVNDYIDSGNSFPKLTPLTAITMDFNIDYSNMSCDYDEILRFPYNYYYVYDKIIGSVSNVVHLDDELCYLKIYDEDNNAYYCRYNLSEDTEIPIPGDKIKISGRYNGLYKKYNDLQYTSELFPLMNVKKCVIEE